MEFISPSQTITWLGIKAPALVVWYRQLSKNDFHSCVTFYHRPCYTLVIREATWEMCHMFEIALRQDETLYWIRMRNTWLPTFWYFLAKDLSWNFPRTVCEYQIIFNRWFNDPLGWKKFALFDLTSYCS